MEGWKLQRITMYCARGHIQQFTNNLLYRVIKMCCAIMVSGKKHIPSSLCLNTCAASHTHMRTHTHRCTHTHTYTDACIHTYTHTHTHTHTHTYTHTHTHCFTPFSLLI